MRLLVVNWQDRTNPQAGGAEVHLHELFGRIAARGHEVTLLCSGYAGAAARDRLDGLDIHRTGGRHTFAVSAWPYYRRHLAGRGFDVIVEDLNKIPVWTPRWGRTPVVCLVHHLFGLTAYAEASWPVALLTNAAEQLVPAVYRHVPFQSVSYSTRDDLVRRGVAASQIDVIVQGIDAEYFTPDPARRDAAPLLVYVGRLKRYKGVEYILRAFAALDLPAARLEIAGAGDHRGALDSLARSLALGDRVRFLGFISQEAKRELLRRAWAVALTSPKEGWGITNVEAAACGTPAVVSNSPGLRESVLDGETGFVVPHGDVAALAGAFGRLLRDPALVTRLGERGRRFAETLTWDRAADHTMAHLDRVVRRGGN
ncbi:MAG: glycosyltransferase family 4 protein [Gemmatimonadaceae bacterium]|jgi:glycosyltransferase involved in cell wall biosynthesis|nr:glycosyltransferase family 4 protein [Gemmatimonadaceae bacterium]